MTKIHREGWEESPNRPYKLVPKSGMKNFYLPRRSPEDPKKILKKYDDFKGFRDAFPDKDLTPTFDKIYEGSWDTWMKHGKEAKK